MRRLVSADCKMTMKWKNQFSSSHNLNGGGPQGGLMGILEYISQTDGNVDFVELEKRFKFIDDVSLLEIVNLISIGLSSYNSKQNVPLGRCDIFMKKLLRVQIHVFHFFENLPVQYQTQHKWKYFRKS